jgi:hypothetical protein
MEDIDLSSEAGSVTPSPNDIVLGRGGLANNHGKDGLEPASSVFDVCSDKCLSPTNKFISYSSISQGGNRRFRKIVSLYKPSYIAAMGASTAEERGEKKIIVWQVMNRLKYDGLRFVQKVDGLWFEAPTKAGRAKTVQALREGAPELRPAMMTEASSSSPPVLKPEDFWSLDWVVLDDYRMVFNEEEDDFLIAVERDELLDWAWTDL